MFKSGNTSSGHHIIIMMEKMTLQVNALPHVVEQLITSYDSHRVRFYERRQIVRGTLDHSV